MGAVESLVNLIRLELGFTAQLSRVRGQRSGDQMHCRLFSPFGRAGLSFHPTKPLTSNLILSIPDPPEIWMTRGEKQRLLKRGRLKT